jgi:hypothetical protein
MKLADALVEEFLGFRRLGRDREIDVARSRDQHGRLPGAFIEDLPVNGMAGSRIGRFGILPRHENGHSSREQENSDQRGLGHGSNRVESKRFGWRTRV